MSHIHALHWIGLLAPMAMSMRRPVRNRRASSQPAAASGPPDGAILDDLNSGGAGADAEILDDQNSGGSGTDANITDP